MELLGSDEIKKLKSEGFLLNRDKEHFAVRILTGNGVVDSNKLIKISEAAKTFGNGKVALTTRLTIEIQGIPYKNIEIFKEFAIKNNLEAGGTGPKIRPIVACKGTVCVYGFYDTQNLGMEIHNRFYEGYRQVTLPHKFKIGVGGCPNNCIKPDLNDIGIMGQRGENTGLKIFIGGKWGRVARRGNMMDGVYTCEEVLPIIESAILYYKENAYAKERFGDMIDRLDFEIVQNGILHDNILNRKSEIIKSAIKIKE